MKFISKFCWLFVGVLFIFSGLIKINDPVGTAIKLEEYFEVFSTDIAPFFKSFEPYSLFLSIFLSSAEIVLGVALLVRFRLKLVLWLLLIMIVFFTFLTFYSAWFNKVTDCGCFGDAIVLTPWESFTKDVVLLVMILILLFTQRYLPPFMRPASGAVITIITAALSVAVGWYAYEHLPYIDFRAYKEGNNIPALMKPSAPLRYKYIMTKNGEEEEFEEYPTDQTYTFKEMVAVNPEDGPKITDFNVWNDEGDFTQEVLSGQKLLIIVQSVAKAEQKNFESINKLVKAAEAAGITPMVVTSSSAQDFEVFRHEVNLAAPYYFGDGTVLKTIIRSNPGLLLLQDGTVMGKWHHNDTPEIEEVKELLAPEEK
ncbi:BT_3928 family protein [Pontibacter actiniarum]|uniref:DoxX family protein n=1 Tax=Pontibacter actiniarum TaxID=323450 RepID=A0A1X9YV58_9BACT|nr:BT_3928 family protein [Pontibacter actiniarum]ARS36800.1 DoxX family protein [Pontibacter actiniarum]